MNVLKMTQNMRLESHDPDSIAFAEYLLKVGENSDPKVDFPSTMSKCADLYELISNIYPGIEEMSKNDEVSEINKIVLEMFNGESHTFLGVDKQELVSGESSTCTTYTSETLNQQNPSGLPPFKLDLKVVCPIMLLRNLAPRNICEQHVIVATILTGDKVGDTVFIPRITLTPSSSNVVIRMTRRQFPVRLAYAMTINKFHGHLVFSNGQLYVALSRCTTSGRIHVLLPKNTRHETTNVVYPEVVMF
ncbi:hypothetical protein MKW98_029291 [Papaver atlanticum]|uniref:ATP-dependent DNA helicase n=1 Tax=Papaver atlanticum TaxID=357466 RepID=A0AAD4XE59_9MAGN|nr:hypothetical protein MKW98_029291 [Papaver atlanticum]